MKKQKLKFKETEKGVVIERKVNRLRELLPLFWNSYQHMYDARKTNIQNNINFLLLIISILSVISITLLTYFENLYFLFPLLIQFLAFIILLRSFFIKAPQIHWFELKETLKNLDSDNFDEEFIVTLKALEDDTYIYLEEMGNIKNLSLYSLIFSLYNILLALAFIYLDKMNLFFLIILLNICFFLIISVYYKKQPKFKFKENYNKYKEEIEKWLTR